MPIRLVCPACRTLPAPVSELLQDSDGWGCARCGARYPHTIAPLVAHPLSPFVEALGSAHGASLQTLAALAPWMSDEAPSMRLLQRAAVATRSHWGDRMAAPRPVSWTAWQPFLEALPPGDACELGCGAGRVALELAARGRRVVALDTDPAVLSLGISIRDSGRAEGVLRTLGASYETVNIEAPELAGRDVRFVLADACNPPLDAEAFQVVVALNLLDNVPVPTTLIGQIDALLAPGGVALLSTPYAWDSAHTEDGERIGGARGRRFGGDGPEELRRILRGEFPGAPWAFRILVDEPQVPFTLARDERSRFVYDAHVLLVQKPA